MAREDTIIETLLLATCLVACCTVAMKMVSKAQEARREKWRKAMEIISEALVARRLNEELEQLLEKQREEIKMINEAQEAAGAPAFPTKKEELEQLLEKRRQDMEYHRRWYKQGLEKVHQHEAAVLALEGISRERRLTPEESQALKHARTHLAIYRLFLTDEEPTLAADEAAVAMLTKRLEEAAK